MADGSDLPERLRPYADRLEPYRTALPPYEWVALTAWLSTFYPFQLSWMLDSNPMAIANKARQIGFSHTTAAVGVLWGAFHAELTTIISIGESESKEVLEKSKRHVVILGQLGSKIAKTKASSAQELKFVSGGRILALPSSGGRGFTGNVFLDEFAYQQHAKDVWDSASSVTLLNGKLRVASTPNGIGNDFHELWELAQNPKSGWTTHETKVADAIAQGYPLDIQRCWERAKGDPRVFDQLFNCSFLDGMMQYIPTENIAACSTNEAPPIEGEHYAGLDIGREADLTVLVVVRLFKGVRYVVHVESMKRTDSDGLEEMVARAFDTYKIRRLCVDATGMGAFPAERLKKRHSERTDTKWRRPRVEPINFTLDVKEDLATGLYSAMTSQKNGGVRIPKTDAAIPNCAPGTADALRKDIASIRRIVTTAGNVRYDAARTSAGHADRAWSLMLALHACSSVNAMREALRA